MNSPAETIAETAPGTGGAGLSSLALLATTGRFESGTVVLSLIN